MQHDAHLALLDADAGASAERPGQFGASRASSRLAARERARTCPGSRPGEHRARRPRHSLGAGEQHEQECGQREQRLDPRLTSFVGHPPSVRDSTATACAAGVPSVCASGQAQVCPGLPGRTEHVFSATVFGYALRSLAVPLTNT